MTNDFILNIEYLPVDQLTPYEQNARKHQANDVDAIVSSIREFGFDDPIGVWGGHNVIVEGHGRVMAAKKLGMKTVPVIHLDHLTDEQRRAYALAHNRTAELSEWDEVVKELELSSISEIDMSLFGFDISALVDDGEAIEDEYDIDAPVEALTKLGDIWQLGRHRLMCGDCTDINLVDKLMAGEKAELLLTDPPYGIKADKGFSGACGFGGKGKPIERRHYKDEWDSERPDRVAFDQIIERANSAIIFGGNFFTDLLPVGAHWLVWNKHNTMPTFSDAELAWTNLKRNSVKLYDVEWNGLIGKEKERFHPTQKPIKLFADIIIDYTKQGETVADFYGGSGSTLIACEQTGRTCYMMELDPHYVDVIIARWEEFTGQKAQLINGE